MGVSPSKREGTTPASAILATIPNGLSLVRLALGLGFPWLPPEWQAGAVLLAGLTDAADGASARLLRADTRAGRVLDPVADRVFFVAVTVTLVVAGGLPAWEAALIGLRDWVMLLGAGWLLFRGEWAALDRLRPRLLGKATTAGQLLYLFLLVCRRHLLWLMLATAIVSGMAALDYLRAFLCRPGRTGRPGSVRPTTRE
jgi:phosphatidylglycerophosphate synthase